MFFTRAKIFASAAFVGMATGGGGGGTPVVAPIAADAVDWAGVVAIPFLKSDMMYAFMAASSSTDLALEAVCSASFFSTCSAFLCYCLLLASRS